MSEATQQTIEVVKHLGDVAAAGTVIGTLIGYLPAVAALFTIIWTALRIFELWTGTKLHQVRLCRCGKKK